MNLLDRMNRYSPEASWAVWERTPEGSLTGLATFPRDAATQLNPEAIFVSLNPARAGVGPGPDQAPDWANFHSANPKHNDIFLAHALVDTRFWGAYMTDLHPTIHESNSGKVKPTAEEIAEAVRTLVEQALELQEVRTVIGVGAVSYRTLLRHSPTIESAIPGVEILGIPHYSRANARVHRHKPDLYREIVHSRLGLTTAEV